MHTYTLIPAHGETKIITRETPMTLDELQGYVGGLIEFVPALAGDSHELCVNEEGLIHRLPPNGHASIIAGRMIVGDALFATKDTFFAEDEEDDDE